jgi:hypothetical protein
MISYFNTGCHPQLMQYARSIDFLFIEGPFEIYFKNDLDSSSKRKKLIIL